MTEQTQAQKQQRPKEQAAVRDYFRKIINDVSFLVEGASDCAKEVDMALGAILAKVQGVKSTLSNFVGKMEHEQLTWPSMLDSFATLSGQMSTLMKQLGGDKLPPLHSHLLLPLQVSSEKDPALEKATEGRVPVLHHEIVPHYLRTKLELELEERQRELGEEARRGGPQKEEIGRFNEILSVALDRVNEAREELEEQRAKAEVSQPNSSAETRKLVAAYLHSQGLAPLSNNRRAQIGAGRLVKERSTVGKAPSAVRVELRQAANTAAAPYPTSSSLKER